MAFTPTIIKSDVFGGTKVVTGQYVNDGGSTGGDITTGFSQVHSCFIQPSGAAILANQSVVNETFPLVNAGGKVTIVTTANETGGFIAYGF